MPGTSEWLGRWPDCLQPRNTVIARGVQPLTWSLGSHWFVVACEGASMTRKPQPGRKHTERERDAIRAARIGGRYAIAAALSAAIVGAVLTAAFTNGFGLFSASTPSAAPAPVANSPGPSRTTSAASAAVIEQRYDGKDPTGKDGPQSKCADPPPSQPVSQIHPSVIGPSRKVVGHVELLPHGSAPSFGPAFTG